MSAKPAIDWSLHANRHAIKDLELAVHRIDDRMKDETEEVGQDFKAWFNPMNFKHFPIFTLLVTFAEIGLYIAMIKDSPRGEGVTKPFSGDTLDHYGALMYFRIEDGGKSAWRFFTSIFVHVMPLHIISNMATQVLLGVIIERNYNGLRLAAIYMIAGLAGSLFSASFELTQGMGMAGASGAIYGLVATFMGHWIKNREQVTYPIFMGLWIVSFIGSTIIQTVFWGAGVSNWAHGGGFIGGLVGSISVLPNYEVEWWEKYVIWIARILLVGIFIALPLYIHFVKF